MASFTPDQLRQQAIELARQNIRGSKNYASTQNRLLSGRDRAIKNPQNITTRRVSAGQVPEGADANTMLELTFNNGKHVVLDETNLQTYAQNINNAREKFKGGIRPQEVIRWSSQVDRDRANEQIFFAALFSRKGDTFRFVTNAWEKSQDQRHYITVQFLNYGAIESGTKTPTPYLVKNHVTGGAGGKIRFTCDCGRHRYYYNYMAGLGNYHIGQKEIRYPYVRNQHLTGLACKHVLRVMQHILSASGIQQILTHIKKDHAALTTGRANATSRAQMERELDRQQRQVNRRNAQLPDQDAIQNQLAREQTRRQRSAEQAAARQAQRQSKKGQAVSRQQARAQLQSLINQFGAEAVQAMLAQMNNTGAK